MYPKISSEFQRMDQEELDIRSLQLLRACIHNEERKLPENWAEDPNANKKLKFILIMDFYNYHQRSFSETVLDSFKILQLYIF